MPEGRRKLPLVLFDKAKSIERWGRKATGLSSISKSNYNAESRIVGLRKSELYHLTCGADGWTTRTEKTQAELS
jgi:hypothetical protein